MPVLTVAPLPKAKIDEGEEERTAVTAKPSRKVRAKAVYEEDDDDERGPSKSKKRRDDDDEAYEDDERRYLRKNKRRAAPAAPLPTSDGSGIPASVGMGVLMMVGAIVWFVGGLAAGFIFYYPPILFILGIASVVKGALRK